MSFTRLEQNELNDVWKEDIVIDNYCSGGHSPNMGKTAIDRLRQTHYDALRRATDILTFSTTYDNFRIGCSHAEKFWFYYRESSSSLFMFDTPSRLVCCFFYPWLYEDQLPLRLYTPLTLEAAKQEMLECLI